MSYLRQELYTDIYTAISQISGAEYSSDLGDNLIEFDGFPTSENATLKAWILDANQDYSLDENYANKFMYDCSIRFDIHVQTELTTGSIASVRAALGDIEKRLGDVQETLRDKYHSLLIVPNSESTVEQGDGLVATGKFSFTCNVKQQNLDPTSFI